MLKPRLLENGSYRVQVRRKTVNFTGCFPTLADAEAALRSVLLREGTFQYFIENEYLQSRAYTTLKPTTQAKYATDLKQLLAYFGPLPLADITTGRVMQYQTVRNRMTTRLGKPPASDTVRAELIVLSRVFAHAVRCDLVKTNPVREASKPSAGTRERRVTTEERATMLLVSQGDIEVIRTPTPRLAPAIKGQPRVRIVPPPQPKCYPPPNLKEACRFLLIQFEVACRAGELAKTEVTALNFERREVAMQTKTQKLEIRPLSLLALRLISEQLEYRQEHDEPENIYLFPGCGPKHYDYQVATTAVREYGIVDATFSTHANRHGYASRSKELGMTKAEIMAMGGWKTGSVVDRYIHTSGMSAVEREPVDAAARKHCADLWAAVSVRTAVLKVATAANEMLEELSNVEAAGEQDIAAMDMQYATNCPAAGPVAATPIERLRAAMAAGEMTMQEIMLQLAQPLESK